jgi:FOG: LysM repeat
MPNNTDETARMLCVAGSWLKNRDPETADLFYKSLVRRNRKTALGAEADRRHWFPEIDPFGNLLQKPADAAIELVEPSVAESDAMTIDGNGTGDAPLPDPPEPPMIFDSFSGEETNPVDTPVDQFGFQYEIVSGDTLAAIARHFSEAGVNVTVEDLMAANSVVIPQRIMAGQKLVIPFHSP